MKLKQAFTLVELLVIIAIIGIVSGSALASYSTLTKQQKLNNTTKQMRDLLELAKRKAVAGEGNDTCSAVRPPMDTVDGYEVNIPSQIEGATAYTMNVLCRNSQTDETQTVTLSSYPYESAVSIQNEPITVDFAAVTGKATILYSTSPIILQTDSNNVKCITISALGVMDEQQNSGCTVSNQ